MRKFGSKGQKILKIFHLIVVAMWLGGALSLVLMIALLGPPKSGQELLGYDLARKFIDDHVIIPGAMGCLLSGLVISLTTPWGFFKHRWVAVKWFFTITCILFGIFILGPMINGQPAISETLGLAALTDAGYEGNQFKSFIGGVGQLTVIFFMTAISVLKPWKKSSRKVAGHD